MRKILLARALLRKPRLLILDDVFAGLDRKYRAHLKHILEKLMKSGAVRVLLINPLPDELPKGITHMLCVENCRVVAQGPRKEMTNHIRAINLFRSAGAAGIRRATPLHFGERQMRSNSEELVKLEGVSVRYNGKDILSDIYWTIHRGESWALVGPNGSGKSTLLSVISGDNPQAYANAVHIFGRRRGSGESVWDIKKRIGFISAELQTRFPEDQTCLETVISGFHESSGCYHRPGSHRNSALLPIRCLAASDFSNRQINFSVRYRQDPREWCFCTSPGEIAHLLLLDEPCQGL